ncbi:MAG: UDP-3-O-(3-hydroxymyristoyl)glucosamine N-acyltransferase [Gemmatimonadota bacterium]|nr:MAG: UDP-3-O-(3-hydroxymyristoyl)glucosamine N-acyltransferase [Gemmatimonadota bacterium]
MSNGITVGELARHLGAEIVGDPKGMVRGAAPIESAREAELSFLARRKYLPYLDGTQATAVIVGRDLGKVEKRPQETALLLVDDAHRALAQALALLYPAEQKKSEIAPTAVVGPRVELGKGVTIGPYTVVGAGAKLGDGVRVGAQCAIGEGCELGAETELKDQVVLYRGSRIGARCIIHSGARIGVDGFGYVLEGSEHRKVPQVGRCVIEDDVEIGANTCIDRGSIGETRIGAGTKIDNLVHIAHNVRVGRGCIIVAQVGVAGSTIIGNGVALAGQVGIIGHLEIGDGARIAAQAGVSHDVPAGETWFGYPARQRTQVMRANAAFLKLPELLRRVQRIEDTLLPEGEAK